MSPASRCSTTGRTAGWSPKFLSALGPREAIAFGDGVAMPVRVRFDDLAPELGKDLDPFDLILHIAFGQKPLTRRERAQNVKKRNVFGKYGGTARQVLEALLDKYADAGIVDIEQGEVLKLSPLDRLGSPVELIQSFGGRPQYLQALAELERSLYQ